MRDPTPLSVFWRKMPRPLRAAAVGLARCLSRPPTADRGIVVLLLGYAVLWAISAEIRNLGVPLHGDMTEAFALSLEPALGYFKHPPLINWIVATWFAVMPIAKWSFYLLGLLNAALAMWLIWLAASYVVDSRRRILAVALLGLTPIFTFHAATFNHNAMEMSLWPLVALTFLASVERPNPAWSALFGAASGLAILGKYYAGLIVLACMLATLLHPNRRSYLRSPRPYLAAAICVTVLMPNLYWLATHDFIAISYHVTMERSHGQIEVITAGAHYPVDLVAFLSAALLALWFCLRPWTAEMWRTLVKEWTARRAVVACLAFTPVALPLLVLPPLGITLHHPWIYPGYFFLPLAIVSAPRLSVTYRAVASIVGAAAVAAVLAVVASPLLMVGNFLLAEPGTVEPFAPLARLATDTWHGRTGRPLEFVSGTGYLVWSLSFYSPDHPKVLPVSSEFQSPAEIVQNWKRRGVLGICYPQESWCNEMFGRLLPNAERMEIALPVTFLGLGRPPKSYVLYVQTPGE